MQKLKRPVSIILSILMVVSMFVAVPVTASAATYVAQIGSTGYETLEDAFAHAVDGDTITLLADTTIEDTVVNTKNITIDFADKTLSFDTWKLENRGNLTVTGTTGGISCGKGCIDNYDTLTVNGGVYTSSIEGSGASIWTNPNATTVINGGTITGNNIGSVNEGGTLTVNKNATISGPYAVTTKAAGTTNVAGKLIGTGEGGTAASVFGGSTLNLKSGADLTGDYGVVVTEQDSVVNVNSGAKIVTDSFAISSNGNAGNGGYTINVKGGTITSNSVDGAAIYHQNNGTLNISGGTITGATGVYIKSGTTNITGGTINGNGAKADYNYYGNGVNATGEALVIDNCSYPGGAPTVSITGGTFNSTNNDALGSYANGDGNDPIEEFVEGTKATFCSAVPDEYCADGFKPYDKGNGKYGVTEEVVAEVNGTDYESFAEAVAARTSNDDVITLKGTAYTYTANNRNKFPIKVNKNGYTVTVKVDDAPCYVTNATADGVTTYSVAEGIVKYTSKNGDVSYTDSLPSAFASGTYQLLDDITRTSRMTPGTFGTDVTLDLNGHTLTSTATDYGILLGRNGSATSRNSFTLTDTSTNGGGKLVANNLANSGTSNTASVISISGNNNNVTISNITIETTQGIGLIGTNQSLTIDNCDITVNGTDYALATNGSQTNGAAITVTGSSIESTNGIAVYLPGGATSTFTDTDVTGTTAMYIKSGTTTIDGGTYTATGDAAEFTHNGNGANATGDAIVVESCNYPNGVPTVSIGATNVVSAHGKQIGDYTYGENVPFGDVTATSNTLTLPEDLKWVETATEGVYKVAPKEYVAQNGETKYEDLQTAINEAQAGDEIVVLDNIALTGAHWFNVYNDVTIDLNGKTISSQDSVFVTKNGADLTVKNGTMTSSVANDYAIYVNDGSVFTLEDDATLTATNSRGNGIIVRTGAQADINGTIETGYYSIVGVGTSVVNVNDGASITSTDASAISGNGSGGNEGYTFNVKGGTLTSTNDVAIYHPNQGTLNITGGTITGKTAVYVKSGSTSISGSSTSISGATIHGTGADTDMVHSGNGCNATGDAIVIENCGYPGGTPSVEISGGTITSDNADAVASYGYDTYQPITKFVSGGTFNTPVPKDYCADGYKPKDNGNGTYGVTKKYFYGKSITLNGNIELNFWIDNNVAKINTADSAKIVFTWDGGTSTAEVNLKGGPGEKYSIKGDYYLASVELVAAQMAHKVKGELIINGTKVEEAYYSVQDYAEELYNNPSRYDNKKPDELKALAKAMLNYGSEAQTVFTKALTEHPDRADSNLDEAADYSGVTAALVKSKINGTASNLNEVATQLDAKYYTNSLIYLQNNTLRIYFTPKTYPADMPNASAYDDNLSGYYYYKDVKDIAAAELDDQQEFTVGSVKFYYSPLNYVVNVLNSGMGPDQKNLAKALFLYNQAANAFFID